MLRVFHRVVGMGRVVAHLTRGAATMAFVFPWIGAERQRRIIQRWSRGVLEIFGLELEIEGMPPPGAGKRALLLVSNHISWVDIYTFLCVAELRFVAKSEVRSWPLIGWFSRRIGTIFVERDRPRDAVRVGRELRSALDEGAAICLFPEGTTTDGSIVLPFSSVLIGAAVDRGVAVQPVSLAYRQPDGRPCARAAFTGDATLVGSIWRLTGGGRSVVRLSFLEPIDTAETDRRTVARRAEAAVRASLGQTPRRPPMATETGPSGATTAQPDAGPQPVSTER